MTWVGLKRFPLVLGSMLLLATALVAHGAASSSTSTTTCSANAVASWQATCSARTAGNKEYIPLTNMDSSDINIDESDVVKTYEAARQTALKLSATVGNAAMSRLRKKTTDWYQKSLRKLFTYFCFETMQTEELERCVANTSTDAARDIDGQCIVLKGNDSCSSQGKCERESNCKWNDAVADALSRSAFFTSDNVTTATKWMQTGYPSSLAPFVAPGIVFAVLLSVGCVAFLILRCVFNQCGGRNPRDKGYSRCDVLIPSIIFAVCTLAVFICMIVTLAHNSNISDGINGVLNSFNVTLENVDVYAANMQAPLQKAVTQLNAAVTTVNKTVQDLDWINTDRATLLQMVKDFGSILSSQGPFPSNTCDTTSVSCIACPDTVCGSTLKTFLTAGASSITTAGGAMNETVYILQESFVNKSKQITTSIRTASLELSSMTAVNDASKGVVDVITSTVDDYSFSRSALVLSVFFLGMISSSLGLFAIFKGVCKKKSPWVHMLHVSWMLAVIVCILGFVLSSSLLALGALWYDACKYMNILHSDVSPYLPTQMASIANACFNDTSVLTAMGLDTQLAFSCALDDSYSALKSTDLTTFTTLLETYGSTMSDYDIKTFGYTSTQSRTLLSKCNSAVEAVGVGGSASFTQENILVPWEAYGDDSAGDACASLTSDDIPVCYMNATCAASSTGTVSSIAKCKSGFASAYNYVLSFSKISTMLDEMRENLLGDTGKGFSSGWNYNVSISEFAQNYFDRLSTVKTSTIDKLMTDGDVSNVLQTIETMRCSESCGWVNIAYNAVHDSVCQDILGTTLAISLCVLFLCIFLLPTIVTGVQLQKRLRGAKKGTYEQLERRLQQLESRSKEEAKAKKAGESGSKKIDIFKIKTNLSSMVLVKKRAQSCIILSFPLVMAQVKELVVLGGGISGLSLAYFLRQAAQNVARKSGKENTMARIRVVEAAPAIGGWIHTANRQDFLFEEGPRGFRPSGNGAEILRLVEQLGLQKEMKAVDAAAKSRYILRDGRVEKIPSSVLEVLQWPLTAEIVKAGIHEFFTRASTLDDESVYAFIARRFSPIVAERLLDPVASGIFGGDIRNLSIRSCFKILHNLERENGSVVRGMLFGKSSASDTLLDGSPKSDFVCKHEKSVSVSFQNGMSTLMQSLESQLMNDPQCHIQRNSKITSIQPQQNWNGGDSIIKLELEDRISGEKKEMNAAHVFSTLPAYQLSSIVQQSLPSLASALNEIKFVSMGMVHVGYKQRLLSSDGFGYLVPSCEKERVLGVVYDSNAFPSQNASACPEQTRLSVMCGGAHFPQIASLPLNEVEDLALDAVRRHLDIKQQPDFVRSLILKNAIPQYHVGFWKTLEQIEQQLVPGLHLGGNSFYGVGLADCVARSKELALEYERQSLSS